MARNTTLQICQFGFVRCRELMFVTLDDVCEKGSSNLAQKDILDLDGDFPIFGAAGYIGNVNFYHQEKPYLAVVKDGAGVGRVMLLPAKSSVIGTMQYIIPKEDIIVEYLYYAVKAMHLEKYYMGAAIPHIYFKDYKKEKLKIRSKIKQEQIVARLDIIEKIINQQKQQLKNLEKLTKARFVEMFGEEKNKVKMVDICSIITDGTHESPKFVNEGIPFIFVSNISDNKIMYDADKYIDKATYDVLIKRTPIEIGDIILSTVGSYGHPAVVKSDKKFLFQRHIAYLKPKREMVNSEYLHTMIMMDYVQHQINLEVKGIAQKTLNLSAIKSLDVLMPSLSQQNEFAFFKIQVDKSKLPNISIIYTLFVGMTYTLPGTLALY